jgi:hypothetical protein
MGLFSKKGSPAKPPAADRKAAPASDPSDPRYPGLAGYHGVGLKKNAMPEQRFKFVRPDGKSDG